MLRDTEDLDDFRMGAIDGSIGHVHDLLFDDRAWVVRFLVVDTGGWLSNRRVLLPPIAVERPDWDSKQLHVSLSRDQVRRCPDVDTQLPVSRQNELEVLAHYGYPGDWDGGELWGEGTVPAWLRPGASHVPTGDPHLRSRNEVLRYRVLATNGVVGDVGTFLVDDQTWALEYLVAGTGHLWTRRRAIVPARAVARVSWIDATVTLALSLEDLKEAHDHDRSSLPRDADV